MYSNALMVDVEDDRVLPMLLAGAAPANENIAAKAAAASLLRGRPASAKTLGTPRRAPVPTRVVGPSRQSIMVLTIASLFAQPAACRPSPLRTALKSCRMEQSNVCLRRSG